MSPQHVPDALYDDLRQASDRSHRESMQRFFKEPVAALGVPIPIVRKFSGTHFRSLHKCSKDDILSLCDWLFDQRLFECDMIALDWIFRLRKEYAAKDIDLFKSLVRKRITNWATCDDFCSHAIGYYLTKFPEQCTTMYSWARSKNAWLRRAAAVSLIYGVRRKLFCREIFGVADQLLADDNDLVQKGYGWALKEASKHFQKDVFDFVMARKNRMPRTALRYAIEKMPLSLKQKAMESLSSPRRRETSI